MADRKVHHPLQDEQGDWSAFRILLTIAVGWTFGFVTGCAIANRWPPAEVWEMVGIVDGALATGAGAPRVARYFKKAPAPDMSIRPPVDI